MSQDVAQAYRLSVQQRTIWEWMRAGQACTGRARALLAGPLDAEALQSALRQVVARHEILRTRFTALPGTREGTQVVSATPDFSWQTLDLRGLTAEEQERELARAGARPWDLALDPPLRACLARLGEGRAALTLELPALCADAWSLPLLVDEIARAYDESLPSAAPVQFVDFSEWQWEGAAPDAAAQGAPLVSAPRLPFEKAPGASAALTTTAFTAALAPELDAALETAAAALGLPLPHLLLAGWSVLLRRLAGQDEATCVAFVGARPPEPHDGLGPYAAGVPLTFRRDGGATIDAVARALDLDALGAWSHERLRGAAASGASLAAAEAIGFDWIELGQRCDARGVTFEVSDVCAPAGACKLRLHALRHAASGLRLRWEYSPRHYDAADVERLHAVFAAFLGEIARRPAAAVERIELPGAPEPLPSTEGKRDFLAHVSFQEQAATSPDAAAVIAGERVFTYREINAQANRLARELRRLGARPERRVGLCLEHSAELIVALLAVLKSGAAFVPLDAALPPERVRFVAQDAGLDLIVASPALAGEPHLTGSARVVTCDLDELARADVPADDLDVLTLPAHLAYVLYTSGSTGRPKGVMVQHDGLSHYLAWCVQSYLGDGCGAPLHSSLAFDLTVTSILAPLMAGRAVVLAPGSSGAEALVKLLRARRDYSFVKLTPAHLKVLASQLAPEELQGRAGVLIVGGEALHAEDVALWRAQSPRTRIVNEYGPTETVVGCSVFELPASHPGAGPIPIGRPLPGASLSLIDPHGFGVPPGAAGELHIGGAGLARGYLDRPDLTAERFVPDASGARPGARVYRSGDLARLLPEGELAYLGRGDTQVKVNGHRVELGEIESVLREQPGVSDAVVRHVAVPGAEAHLVAYVVGAAGDEAELRGGLQARLPEYMVPWQIVRLEALPLTPNGKVDLRALPVPEQRRRDLPRACVAPLEPEEEVLAGVWAQVLQLDQVGVEDNYFALGGDSIRSIQVVAQARERGLEFSVDELFQHSTIKQLVAAMRERDASRAGAAPSCLPELSEADRRLLPEGVEDAYPLTELQAGMIFHREYAPGTGIYHDISSVHLRGPLDLVALRRALHELHRRHPALRTSFDMTRFSEPLQLVHREPLVSLDEFDLRGLNEAEQEAAIQRYFEDEKEKSFDWARLPLIRFGVHQRGTDTWQFSLSFHHAILDGWSEATMLTELFQHYVALRRDPAAEVPVPVTRFRDFVDMERRALASSEAREFWRAQVAGSELVRLPRRGTVQSGPREIIVREVMLPPDVPEGLRRVARLAAVPLKNVLLAAHFRVMALVHGSSDVVTCVVSSGRPEQLDGERVLGLFINSIPLRLDLRGGTWVDLAGEAFDAERRALPHRRYPMSEVKRWVGGRPLSESLFYFTHYHVYQAVERCDEIAYLDGKLYEETSFTMASNFRVDPFDASVHCTLKCDSRELSREQIEALAEYYRQVLVAMARAPLGRYEGVDLVPEQERRLLLSWSGADEPCPPPPARGLHELFEEQARRRPAEVALVDRGLQITYAELNARANRLARHLRERGVSRETRVGIYLERSADVAVAILAVLKAGGAYVPVDPAYPAARVTFTLKDAGVALVLTEPELAPRLDGQCECLLQAQAEADLAGADGSDLGLGALPHQLAYVIYTSGSTGTPKGTLVEHDQVVRLFTSTARWFQFSQDDVWTLFHSYAFDFSVWELWGALLHGGRLVIVPQDVSRTPEEFHALLARERVTVLNQTPSAFRQLAAVDAAAGTPELALRLVVFGGEALDLPSVQAWTARRGPRPTLINMYGITETTVHVTYAPLSPEAVAAADGASSPIGRALPDLRVYLLDQAQQPVPPGVPGEIYVGGAGVSRGYGGRAALCATRFVPDPFGAPGGRLYRSGDRARFLDDGTLQYLGRFDDQVKIRGFRVELGEIESSLRLHPAVEDCVVVVRAGEAGDQRLVAYVVAREGASPTPPELTRHLRERLPGYMVPAVVMLLPALPQTAHGKVDRRRLPDPPQERPELESVYVAPTTALEEVLCSIWCEVLRLERVGVHDNFFELGGHSLLATQVIATVREALHVDLPLRALYDAPTVGAFVPVVAQAQTGEKAAERAELAYPVLTPDAANRYEPFPLTDIQEAYWVGRKAEFELGDTPAHIYLEFDTQGLDLARLETCVRQLVARHDMLRVVVLADGRQQILEHVPPYEIGIIDLRGLGEAEAEERIESLRHRMSHQKFDTTQWPLFEVKVHKLGAERARVHFSIDLLVTDADSLAILNRELGELYHNPDAVLRPLDITFRDYVLAEQAFRGSERYRRARDYWVSRLDTLPPAPELPLEKPLASLASGRFARATGRVEPETWRRLKRRAVRAGLTPSSLLLSAYSEVLAQWSRRPRFTVNVTTYNSLPFHPQVRHLVGDFTYLTLVAVESREATFEQRAKAIQGRFLEDMEHNSFSGLQVLRELTRRRAGAPPSMPVVFTSTLPLHTREKRKAAIPAELTAGITQSPQTLLDHQVSEVEEALTIRWDYVEEAFPAGLVEEMFAAYTGLLERLAHEESAWTGETRQALLPAAQRARREAVNATEAERPAGLLQDGFWEQVERRPEAPAVKSGGRVLTYAELAGAVTSICDELCSTGVASDELVAVVMEKGWEQVAAVLAVVESGAAYLPIDAAWPEARQRELLERGGVRVVVTQERVSARTAWPEGLRVIAVPEVPPTGEPRRVERAASGDLAYVIFTSGSTGKPKGVRIDHGSALNTIADINRRFGVDARDRVLALSALSFDLSVYDVFGLLGAGGCVVVTEAGTERNPEAWWRLMTDGGVTVWNSVPALLEMLLEYAEGRGLAAPESLRLVMLSGDWIPVTLPERLKNWAPQAKLVSLGGATEASIWSIAYEVGDVDEGWTSIPYGTPLANQTFHVLSSLGLPAPEGVPGELYIGGSGLAQGYWRDAVQTASRFVPHPGGDGRLYRTGDWGRYRSDGTIEFLGRQDLQVKVGGHRIELGEIETQLNQHEGVSRAVVTVAGDPRGARQLVAYVVPAAEAPQPAAASQAGPVLDADARGAFKAQKLGLRRFEVEGTALEVPAFAAESEALWQRRSHARFRPDDVGLQEISGLLAPLRQIESHGKARRAYGSAGGLYPVQVYVAVRAGRAREIDAGTYYYDPAAHRLVPLSSEEAHDEHLHWPANRAMVRQAAFSVFLVADMRAIEPLYGGVSRDFCLLEAGLITQLLESTAPHCGLGLCQVGSLDFEKVRGAFRLDPSHVLLHSLVGGAALPLEAQAALPKAAARPSAAVRVEPALQAQLAAHLRRRLPDYMVPRQFMFLDALPLSANGKLDRAALPRPAAAEREGSGDARPVAAHVSALEQTLLSLLSQELGLAEVSAGDNFFDLGATSLSLVRLHRRLESELGRTLPLMSLFEQPNAALLARFLAQKPHEARPEPLSEERAARQREARRRRRARVTAGAEAH